MSNMSEYLLSDEGLRAMMNLLLICVALVIAVVGFLRYCERTDAIWQAENPAPRYPVNPSNAADLLAGMDCLRTPLHLHRNMEGAASAGIRHMVNSENIDHVLALHGVTEQDRADIIKGSKLS